MALDFSLQLVAPQEIIFDASVTMVNLPLGDGYATIMAGHVPFIAELKAGFITIEKINDHHEESALDKLFIYQGFVHFDGAKAKILASEFIPSTAYGAQMMAQKLAELESEAKNLDNECAKLAKNAPSYHAYNGQLAQKRAQIEELKSLRLVMGA